MENSTVYMPSAPTTELREYDIFLLIVWNTGSDDIDILATLH